MKFTKQSPNKYHNDPAGAKKIIPHVILAGHGWFGVKYIHIILSRDMKNPKVKLEQWMNFNGDGKTWIKINEVIDTRSHKWGRKAICEGQDYEVGAWVRLEWYTSGMVEMSTLNGFHATNKATFNPNVILKAIGDLK